MTNDGQIKAVQTTNQVIKALVELDGGGVSEVSDATELPITTVHNHLTTLRDVGFVCKKGTTYHPSSRFLEIGTTMRLKNDLYTASKRHIQELAAEYDEAVGLLIEEEGYSVMYYAVEKETLDLDINNGTRIPMNLTAAGKAMLACMDDERVEEIVEKRGMPGLTERTITTKTSLFEELERIREQGYAVARGENVDGMFGLAVGLDGPGHDVGAILLYGPASRLAEEETNSRIVQHMRQIKEMVEVNLRAPEIT